MKPPKKKRLGAGRVAFLARVERIQERLNAGYTMASIYEDYQEQLGIGYKQFVNYVNKYIRNKRTAEKEEEKQKSVVQTERAVESTKPTITEETTTGTKPDDEDDLEGKATSGDFF